MVLDFTRHEMNLLSALLQARIEELNPVKSEHHGAHAVFGGTKDDLETILHLKERLDFALVGRASSDALPHNILYSDSYGPNEDDWAPGHRHNPLSPSH